MPPSDDFDAGAFREFEHSGWEAAGEGYHAHFVAVTNQTVAPLLDAASVGKGTRVLDVATGPGNVVAAAAARGADVVGIDFSPAQVALARRLNPELAFQEGDAENLSFDDGAFGAVVMNYGMLHFPHPERALAEAHRVLKSGGRIAFSVWAPPASGPPFAILFRVLEEHGNMELDLAPGPPFFRFADPDECSSALREAGFEAVEVREVPQTLRLASAAGLYGFFADGSVRAAALLQGQTETARAVIRAAMREAAVAYERAGRVEMSMPAVLSSATKP